MKISKTQRRWALLLAIVIVLSAFPTFTLPSIAANPTGSLSASGLSVVYEKLAGNASSCALDGTNITATAQSKSGIGDSYKTAGETKITFTNTGSSIATLTFNYTGSGVKSLTVDGTTYDTSAGSVTKALAATTGTLVIEFTSDKGSLTKKQTATLNITDVALSAEKNVTVTFKAPVNGSYTIDSNAVGASGYSATKKSTESFAAVATPATGYNFFGWYNETTGTYLSYKASDSLTLTDNATVYPEFIPNTTALFDVGGVTFYDLTKAGQHAASGAVKTIVLLNNGTVSGSHIIPAGVTLLVPFDNSNTMYTSKPACTSSILNNVAWVQPTAYRTLTLAADANIIVNGSISVSAKHAASNGNQPYCGAPTGPVGWVKMLAGSQITLNSGANLYAWGFIQGAGTITAKNGSHVYENFQFTDFRGGSNLTQMTGDGLVFPINQYYVQNIEVRTIYEAGAKETLYTSAYASAMVLGGAAPFIGEGGMFVIKSGYIVKDYIENRDRLQVDVYGDIDMSSMSVDVGTPVDSSGFVLPITSNITININSGTTTVKQSIALLPGVEMTIAKDSILDIGYRGTALNDYNTGGYHLIVYDRDEWFYGIDMETSEEVAGAQYAFGSSTGLRALPFVPGRTYDRAADKDLNDAFIDVNGTIIANGNLYTTLGGAAIKSTGKTGVIRMESGSGEDLLTFQANGGTSLAIPINSASLMNGDGSYLHTGPSLADDTIPVTETGTIFEYCATHDFWYTGKCEECNAIFEITWIVNGIPTTQEVKAGEVLSPSDPTKDPDASGHYTFAGWATTENGIVLNALPKVTANATYYAVFTSEAHNKDEVVDGKHYCDACDYDTTFGSCSDTNGDHKCDVGGEDYVCHQGMLIWQKGQAETCGVDGWKGYYKCSCGKLYENADATGEITDFLAWKTGAGKLSATGNHTPEADDGDCTTPIKCSACGTVTTEGKTHYDSDDKNHVCDNDGCTVDNVDGGHTPAADDGDCTTAILCTECGTVTTAGKANHVSNDDDHDCDNCDVKDIEGHTPGAAADCENDQICTECGEVLDEAKNHAWSEPSYTVNSDGTHTAKYVCANNANHTKFDAPVEHVYDNVNHKCVCGEVEKFTLIVEGLSGSYATVSVPYGANVMEYINALVEAGKVDISTYYEDYHDDILIQQGKCVFGYWVCGENGERVNDETTMEEGTWVEAVISFTGWWCVDGNWVYQVDSERIKNSWALINHADYLEDGTGSDWYYFDNDGYRVDGITRVPYPTDKINGVEYKTEADATEGFIDYSSAWFVFGEDGKFLCDMTGIVDHDGTTRYVANGMIPWHYGLATDGTDYYYFIGDVDNGGNVLATGDVYMIRPNSLTINGKNAVAKGSYTFDADGKLCLYDGITKVGNVLRYYSDYCYTAKRGLVEVEVEGSIKYIYVSSTSASLVAGKEYYVPAGNSYGIVSGMYEFDENGYLVGVEYTDKNGIYLESDAYYYYKDGVKYYAGLILYTGTASDGTVYDNDYIYVCSDGHLATGKYWITKSNGNLDATTYLFDEFGRMDMRNGIVEENGSLYYYVNGVLACGKGLIKLGDNYYYVRSDGEVVNNREYWITNTNDYDVLARIYKFDENGVMLNVELKDKSLNGVVDGYYYVDGQVQYGAGPIVWEGDIYYVRSTGEVATGKYWTTTANDILPSGKYTFDETGKLVK